MEDPKLGLGDDTQTMGLIQGVVCLANPQMTSAAKCVLPVCLASPQYLSKLGYKSLLTPTLCATMKEITLNQTYQDQ